MNYNDDAFVPAERTSDFFLGLDLAPVSDITALVIVERAAAFRVTPVHYSCRALKRWPPGTAYPEIIRDLGQLVRTVDFRGLAPLAGANLVVDCTGVGKSVVDLIKGLPFEWFARVRITNSHAVTLDASGVWNVPRNELVAVLQTLLQTRRLKIAQSLPEAEVLSAELLAFKAKVPTLADPYESWRERDHDDLVLGLAVALWYAERHPPEWQSQMPEVLGPGKRVW